MQFADADITAMLAAFGTTAEFGLYEGIKEYTVVYDAPGKELNMFTGAVETTAPGCLVSESDWTESAGDHGTVVTIGDERFSVIGIEPDGYGFVRLLLTRDFE